MKKTPKGERRENPYSASNYRGSERPAPGTAARGGGGVYRGQTVKRMGLGRALGLREPKKPSEETDIRKTAARGRGSFTLWLLLAGAAAVLAVFLGITFGYSLAGKHPTGNNTVIRERLAAGSVNKTAYYSDGLGWIKNSRKLVRGMSRFYRRTGIQPYLYLTGDIGQTDPHSESSFESYASQLYSRLFTDEAHLLVIIYGPDDLWYRFGEDYLAYAKSGVKADTLADSEVRALLLENLELSYYSYENQPSEEREKRLSDAFAVTAEELMPRSPWKLVLVAALAVAVTAIAADFIRSLRRQKAQENQQAAAKVQESEDNSDFIFKELQL